MPRMARINMPGALAHIMAHSVEGRDLFLDDEDRNEFLKRFETHLDLCGYHCFAWTLMDNHYHFLVRTNHLPMSKLMQPLNSGYARFYNTKYERSGYLFQGRFKSVLCQDQNYAKKLIKYIHLNPVRAGKVKSLKQLEKWNWCGHGHLLGSNNANGFSFQNREESLRRFSEEEKTAIQNYLNFLAENYDPSDIESAGNLSEDEKAETVKAFKGLPAVIGNPDFVKKAKKMYQDAMEVLNQKNDYTLFLQKTAEEICGEFKITQEEFMKKGAKGIHTQARAVFCHKAHLVNLIPIKNIANYLSITISPVSVLVKKGALIQKSKNTYD